MPESITIGAFVLGAVLLLLALAGGSFKIFAAEVSGRAGKLARTLAFVLGVGLVTFGLLRESGWLPSPPGRANAADTVGRGANHGTPSAPDPESPNDPGGAQPEPAAIADVSGEWRDDNGSVYRITQQGSSLIFEGYNPTNGHRLQGTGTISGREITSTFQTSIPSQGTGTATVSADGSRISGYYMDSQLGRYSQTMYR